MMTNIRIFAEYVILSWKDKKCGVQPRVVSLLLFVLGLNEILALLERKGVCIVEYANDVAILTSVIYLKVIYQTNWRKNQEVSGANSKD